MSSGDKCMEMSSARQVQPMTHEDFMVELVCQLCVMDKVGVPQSRRAKHIPVPIDKVTDPGQKATKGRLRYNAAIRWRTSGGSHPGGVRPVICLSVLYWTGTAF